MAEFSKAFESLVMKIKKNNPSLSKGSAIAIAHKQAKKTNIEPFKKKVKQEQFRITMTSELVQAPTEPEEPEEVTDPETVDGEDLEDKE